MSRGCIEQRTDSAGQRAENLIEMNECCRAPRGNRIHCALMRETERGVDPTRIMMALAAEEEMEIWLCDVGKENGAAAALCGCGGSGGGRRDRRSA